MERCPWCGREAEYHYSNGDCFDSDEFGEEE